MKKSIFFRETYREIYFTVPHVSPPRPSGVRPSGKKSNIFREKIKYFQRKKGMAERKAKKRHRINLEEVNRLMNEPAEPEEGSREDLM